MDTAKIAKNLREIRGTRSREEMAKILGVTLSAVSNYENADRIPRDDIKIRYAKASSGRTVEDIFFA